MDLEQLLKRHNKAKPDPTISLPAAKDHGFYAGILYPYLLKKQTEYNDYGDILNKRRGLKWIVSLTMAAIVSELPIFPDAKEVKRAADTLEAAGLILTESTGDFLERDHVTGRKRDTATWWHADPKMAPKKAYLDEKQRCIISASETAKYGIPQALILAYWRHSPVAITVDELSYKKLSAAEMENVLPLNERTIRRHLKELTETYRLIQYPGKPKLYGML